MTSQTTWKKFFLGKDGQPVIAQFPNLPIVIWAVAAILGRIFESGTVHDISRVVSVTALLVWSLLEIFRGDSMFRRVLGVVILIVLGTNLL